MNDYKVSLLKKKIKPKFFPFFMEDLEQIEQKLDLEIKLNPSDLKSFRYGSKSPLNILKKFLLSYRELLPELQRASRNVQMAHMEYSHREARQELEEISKKLDNLIFDTREKITDLWDKDPSIFTPDQLEIRSLLATIMITTTADFEFLDIWESLVLEYEFTPNKTQAKV